MEKYKALKLLAKAFTAEILQALNENSLRFVDLKEHCPNDRTRALRLKELRKRTKKNRLYSCNSKGSRRS